MWITISILAVIILTAVVILSQSKFGKNPDGNSIDKIKTSKNFADGEFKNLSESPVYSGDGSVFKEAIKFFLLKVEHRYPDDSIPYIKTDLKNLDPNTEALVWLGHSSYYIQLEGKKILVDPVLSGYAAPFESMNKAFKGSDWYKVENVPDIDYLFISHDHYDHLDYETILKLKDKVKQVICPLGVGSHFEHWGYDKKKITELDWYEKADTKTDWEIYATPARHYSGRGVKRNKTLWASFVLKTSKKTIYIGGDSGYDTHFAEIGNKYGPFDLAILELGQYHQNWKFIHMLPEHFFLAANDLKAKKVMGVHNSKFALGKHAWYDPLETITELSKDSEIPLLTPMIGEPLNLNDSTQIFTKWWVGRK
ncbi:MAG: MBL fold metallo-hydrolase [Candidatus Methanofastidiosa archaeon]|nr:MBL fold metallo-hydrolase [Candidatus Methanofastidiosa archaeon]